MLSVSFATSYNRHYQMRNTLILAAIFACITFNACKKKDIPYGFPVTEYTKLAPGNYWIYETFEVDSNGSAAPGSQGGGGTFFDSVYVEKDTLIGNYMYHKVMTPDLPGSHIYAGTYLRDSLNYEVNSYGVRLFTPDNTNTPFYSRTAGPSTATADSAYRIELVAGNVNEQFTTPAGTFTTIATIANWTFYPYASSSTGVHYRHQFTRYAAGIGMITETLPFYAALPTYTERRLVRYHLQ